MHYNTNHRNHAFLNNDKMLIKSNTIIHKIHTKLLLVIKCRNVDLFTI